MNFRPLIFIVLLALLYWDAPRLVPYTTAFARWSIVCVALLTVPAAFYLAIFRVPKWPLLTSLQSAILIMGMMGCLSVCAALAFALFWTPEEPPQSRVEFRLTHWSRPYF